MYRVLGLVRRMAVGALDVVLPPRCPSCKIIVPEAGVFCAACWNRLDFLTDPMCACCGFPFPYEVGEGALCAECAAERPVYGTARAALGYNDASAGLVLALKYGDRTHLARVMARMMARVAAGALVAETIVVPVPLHPRRIRRRLYNQSALLAQALVGDGPAELGLAVLVRTRDTAATRGLSRKARAQNVRGAFQVTEKGRARIAGRRVLLVDDVLTTGATVKACTRALRRAGCSNVDIVTFARVTNYENKSV